MTLLFPEGLATSAHPGGQAEPIAHVLARRAGDAWQRVRDLVQGWFDLAPASSHRDLQRKLTSKKDREFRAGFLELYCHQLLLRSRFSVEAHPKISGSRRHPDFAGSRADGQLYLEATSMAPTTEDEGAETRLGTLVDQINARIPTNGFSLDLQVERIGEAAAPAREICADIQARLSHLDPDHADPDDNEASWTWTNGDWILELTAHPLAEQHRRDGGRVIGTHGRGIHVLQDVDPTAALMKKVDDYGRTRLARPFLVGIDITGFPDDQDIMNSLYGKQVLMSPTAGGQPAWRRASHGIWRGEQGWIRPHLSAILTVDDLQPWKVASLVPTLWHHPAATHPTENPFTIARDARLNASGDEVLWQLAAVEPATYFDLDPGWPHWRR